MSMKLVAAMEYALGLAIVLTHLVRSGLRDAEPALLPAAKAQR